MSTTEISTERREDWFGVERATKKVLAIDTDINRLYGAQPIDVWDLHQNLKGLAALAEAKAKEVEEHLAERMVAATDGGSIA